MLRFAALLGLMKRLMAGGVQWRSGFQVRPEAVPLRGSSAVKVVAMVIDVFSAGLRRDLPLTRRSVAAVDLGFGASETCGIAIGGMKDTPKPFLRSFGGCVSHIARLVKDGTIDALIVEAPLSGIFNHDGDPQWRPPFERKVVKNKTERRYWYTQPGSTVCLAAVAFFSRLLETIPKSDRSVLVFEGYFTFKPKGRSDHIRDAVKLVEAAIDPKVGIYYQVAAPEGGRLLSVLSLLGAARSSRTAPAVIACEA